MATYVEVIQQLDESRSATPEALGRLLGWDPALITDTITAIVNSEDVYWSVSATRTVKAEKAAEAASRRVIDNLREALTEAVMRD